jgi:heat shock protein HtpX
MQAFGLYSHIRANRIRSAAILVGFVVLALALLWAGNLVAAGMASNGRAPFDRLVTLANRGVWHTWHWAVAFCLLWFAIAFVAQEAMIDASVGSSLMGPATEKRLKRLMEPLCISVGMAVPKLKIIETDALNAFASGFDERDAAITVTRGLMERLDDRELAAVLAHELTHIRNQDVRLIVIAAIFAGILSFAGEMMFRMLAGGSRGNRNGGPAVLVAIVIALVAWLLSIVLRFALSRRREFLADAGAVELTKDPDAMISALMKISGRSDIPDAPSMVREAFIENAATGLTGLFATHPPIETRIDALRRFAGGRMPSPPDDGNLSAPRETFGRRRGPWEPAGGQLELRTGASH